MDEEIVIGPDIVIRVCMIGSGRVKLGIIAPPEVTIHRRELLEPELPEELGGES